MSKGKKTTGKRTTKQAPKPRNPMARELASPLFRARVQKKKGKRDDAERAPDLAELLTPDE